MNFIFISILAYALNAGATIVDKILLVKTIPTPLVYVFYINLLGLLAIFLLPFGVILNPNAIVLAVISGVVFVAALYFYFSALKVGEASVVAPIAGSLNPLFSLILGSIFLGQLFSNQQYLAFFVIILGTGVLTFNLWFSKVSFNKQLIAMVIAGFCFAVSYLFLKESYLLSNFLTGLVFNRLGGASVVLSFLLFPSFRRQIFASNIKAHHFANKTSIFLMFGQLMGGTSGLLLNYAISLANPALVNSLFGVQYLVILITALLLGRKKHNILEEHVSGGVLFQKILGAVILSLGVYLLAV